MSEPRKVAEAFPVCEYVFEEMQARGWSLDRLAKEMTGPVTDDIEKWKHDWGINRLVLDFMVAQPEIYDEQHKIRLGADMAELLGKAFGVSPQLFLNLEEAWILSRFPEAPHAK